MYSAICIYIMYTFMCVSVAGGQLGAGEEDTGRGGESKEKGRRRPEDEHRELE